MNKTTAIFLQVTLIAISIATMIFLIVEPLFEGRNANASLYEVYFRDPFLAGAYLFSFTFFIGLWQMSRIVHYSAKGEYISEASVSALRQIKICAAILFVGVLSAEIYLIAFMRGKDDIAGGVAMGLLLMLICISSGIAAHVFENKLKRYLHARTNLRV